MYITSINVTKDRKIKRNNFQIPTVQQFLNYHGHRVTVRKVSSVRVHVERIMSHFKDWKCLMEKPMATMYFATYFVNVRVFLTITHTAFLLTSQQEPVFLYSESFRGLPKAIKVRDIALTRRKCRQVNIFSYRLLLLWISSILSSRTSYSVICISIQFERNKNSSRVSNGYEIHQFYFFGRLIGFNLILCC